MVTRSLGSVRRKGNRWELRWSAPDPITGRAQRRSKLVFAPDIRAARKLLLEQLDAIPTADISVTALCYRWLQHSAPDKSTRTVEEQERSIRLHVAPHFPDVRARDVTARQLNELYAVLLRGHASGTVRHVANILRASYELGITEDWLTVNPVKRSRIPALRAKPIEVPLASDLAAVLNVCDEQTGRLAFLAVVTGARRGELVGLRWRDVDWDRNVITIQQAATTTQGGVTLKEPKTGKARRIVVDSSAIDVLRDQYQYHRFAGFRGGPDCYVFASPKTVDGDWPMHPHSFTQSWRDACARAGVHIRFHDLRHFAASVLLERGARIHDVQARLGHAKPSTTLNVYGHLIVDAGQEHSRWLSAELMPPAESSE